MPFAEKSKQLKIFIGILSAIFIGVAMFSLFLRPVSGHGEIQLFRVGDGVGFRKISSDLESARLIRSRVAFGILGLLTGKALKLKPGTYELAKSSSSYEILSELASGAHREVAITIIEGASVYEIDKILDDAGVLNSDELINLNKSTRLEGKLFPDTYRFFLGSDIRDVVAKFLNNFQAKADLILSQDKKNLEANLILASLIEKEVIGDEDRKIVSGILKKRLAAGVALQVDSTICYIKRFLAQNRVDNCYPLSKLDFKVDLPYNTYLHAGLPPGPVGNPGISAIEAALHPKNTPYWYYLSDPKTGKTVFAKTLDEHNKNRFLYLGIGGP